MMTVRFPNGQAVQYNTANYVTRTATYADLYEQKDGRWIAQVPCDCIIEVVAACRVYDAMRRDEQDALSKDVRAIRRKLREVAKRK